MPFCRVSSQPRDQTQVSHAADRYFLHSEPPRKPRVLYEIIHFYYLSHSVCSTLLEQPGNLIQLQFSTYCLRSYTVNCFFSIAKSNCKIFWSFLFRLALSSPGEENGNSLQYSHLENSMNSGAWWATFQGVTKELDMIKTTTKYHYSWKYPEVTWNFILSKYKV